MSIMELSARRLRELGHTEEKLRARLRECRRDMRDMREGRYFPDASDRARWQYRALLIMIYKGLKQDLKVLESEAKGS